MAQTITWLMVGYFLAIHGIYLMLTLLAARALYRNQRYREIESLPLSYSLLTLPISVLVPAFNEETTIVATVESLLQISYGEFEIIVINDGSKDATLQVLIEQFDLLPYPEVLRVRQ
jgi:cellulose synthase/poly-beta-1,6-N-acetylglucosamine synthase-like glycosyltransferase